MSINDLYIPVSSRVTVSLMGWKRLTWDAKHLMTDKWLLLTGLKLIILLELNSPVSDPSIFSFDVLSEMHYVINFTQEISCHIFKTAILTKMFRDFMNHIIREYAGKKIKVFLNVSPLTIVNLLLWPFKVSSRYLQQ